jgi:hypothetical protein
MNACQARGDKQALRRLLGSAVLLSWLVYWSGAAFLIIVGNQILTALGKGTPLLPIAQLTALTIIFFLEMNHSVFAAYLTTLNEVPFMGAAIASGVLTVVLATLLCGTVGLGVWGLVVAQGTVQAAYNNWKWPREALHDVGASLWSLICMASMAMFRLRSR